MRSGRRQVGFTYLVALLLVASSGIGLAMIGELWSQSRQREKEAELLWIGNQFRQAIGLYYHRTPGAIKRYPETLEDLMEDRRFPSVQQYLRKLYADPMTGKAEWGLVPAPGGGIMGIHSQSGARPIKQRSLAAGANQTLSSASSYRDWVFFYEPVTVPPPSSSKSPALR